MLKKMAIALLSLIILGCSSNQYMTTVASVRAPVNFNEKSLISTKRNNDSFFSMAPSPGYFFVILGPVGYVIIDQINYAPGRRIIKKNSIQDPSSLIANKISLFFNKHSNIKLSTNSRPEVKKRNLDKLPDEYSNDNYILDVRTKKWGSFRSKFLSRKRHFIYIADIRIIDNLTKQKIFYGTCRKSTLSDKNLSYVKDYAKDNGKLLNSLYEKFANECVDDFTKQTLPLIQATSKN